MISYFYEETDRGVYLWAIGGDWTGRQLIAWYPHG